MFIDRAEAGAKLLERLPPLDPDRTVIIALPRGGLPVAEVIADGLGAPLDVALVRKVGLPGQEELALAAVTDGDEPRISINREVAGYSNLSEDRIWDLAKPHLSEIARRRDLYLGGRAPLPVQGRTAVVVDDGIATGTTMRAALTLLRAQDPARLIVAVPVAPKEALAELEGAADEVLCLSTPSPFVAVGLHYRHFDQVPDETVVEILGRHLSGGPSVLPQPPGEGG